MATAGCGGLVTGSPEDHHEDDHSEHHVPEHRPARFTEAVDQIEHRFNSIQQATRSGGILSDQSLSELTDILTWLPEIAADSDMRRGDWEQVDEHSFQLLRVLKAWEKSGDLGELPEATLLAQSIAELKGLRGKEHPAE